MFKLTAIIAGGAGLIKIGVAYGGCGLLLDTAIIMGIISVYIISKAGGMIFSHDMPSQSREGEVEFQQYPVVGMLLEEVDRNLVVKFGEVRALDGGLIQGK